eukprot:scaffold6899_cov183-Amphora_coffeaeformis.AAC.45
MVDANVALVHQQRYQGHLHEYLVSESAKKNKSEQTRKKYKSCDPIDILTGRGQLRSSHPGNWLFRQVISMNKEYYAKQPLEEKKSVATLIMQRFEQVGTRFLEEHGDGNMISMQRERVIEKFMQALREKKCNHKFVLDAIVEQLQTPKPSSNTATNATPTKKKKEKKQASKTSTFPVKSDIKSDPVQSSCSGTNMSVGCVASLVICDMAAVGRLETFFEGKGTNLNRFIQGASLKTTSQMIMQIKKYLRYNAEHGECLNAFPEAQPLDVLFGKGSVVNSHPGNIVFRHVTVTNQDFYDSLDRSCKNEAAMALAGYFVEAGARFLERDGECFREVTQDRVIEKFMQALRERRRQGYSHGSSVSSAITKVKEKIKSNNKRARQLKTEFESYQDAPRKKQLLDAKQKLTEVVDNEARDEQRIHTLLSVGHYVAHFSEDDEPDIKQEDESSTLQEIRLAFRDSVYQSTPAAVKARTAVTPELKTAVHQSLFNLYRPSPLRKFVSDVKTPLPVFFSDS